MSPMRSAVPRRPRAIRGVAGARVMPKYRVLLNQSLKPAHPPGIEPGSVVPETAVLSVELWVLKTDARAIFKKSLRSPDFIAASLLPFKAVLWHENAG